MKTPRLSLKVSSPGSGSSHRVFANISKYPRDCSSQRLGFVFERAKAKRVRWNLRRLRNRACRPARSFRTGTGQRCPTVAEGRTRQADSWVQSANPWRIPKGFLLFGPDESPAHLAAFAEVLLPCVLNPLSIYTAEPRGATQWMASTFACPSTAWSVEGQFQTHR
jgi:hypothetical protein